MIISWFLSVTEFIDIDFLVSETSEVEINSETVRSDPCD